MSSQFDEKLIQKIRDAFDHYEDGQADYGWLELRKVYPAQSGRKSKPALYNWIGSAAAVLLLAFGAWALLQDLSPEALVKEESKAAVIKKSGIKELEKQKNMAEKHHSSFGRAGAAKMADTKKQLAYSAHTSSVKVPLKSPETVSAGLNIKDEGAEAEAIYATAELSTKAADTNTASLNTFLAETGSASNDKTLLAQNTGEIPAKRSLTDIALEPSEKNDEKKEGRKVSFSIYAGSFISYADGSSNKINLGAGFSSDIALTKNLKLSAGLALSKNDLSFKHDIPLTARNSFTSAYNSPVGLTASIKVMSYDLKSYDASLLGLDIPLNLTYILDEKKNELFISAGISSGTFINESYTYYYQSQGAGNGRLPEAVPAVNKDEVQSELSSFEFARMLNFSFGMGYPIGRKNKLIIEPFLKYPLKSIGEEDLRFGAGGINLKFNFKSSK